MGVLQGSTFALSIDDNASFGWWATSRDSSGELKFSPSQPTLMLRVGAEKSQTGLHFARLHEPCQQKQDEDVISSVARNLAKWPGKGTNLVPARDSSSLKVVRMTK